MRSNSFKLVISQNCRGISPCNIDTFLNLSTPILQLLIVGDIIPPKYGASAIDSRSILHCLGKIDGNAFPVK